MKKIVQVCKGTEIIKRFLRNCGNERIRTEKGTFAIKIGGVLRFTCTPYLNTLLKAKTLKTESNGSL